MKDPFDFPDDFETSKEGLLAMGGNLHPMTLIHAYAKGIFPWFNKGDPILWWHLEPRAVIFPEKIHISASMRKFMRRVALVPDLESECDGDIRLRVTVNHAFERVMRECADKRYKGREDTWIGPEMMTAYKELHRLRFAQSVEVWDDRGILVGGVYGVSLGLVFFGESMFSHTPNASKTALIVLCRLLHAAGYRMLDCQVVSSHLTSLGACGIVRREFLRQLQLSGTANLKAGAWLTCKLLDTQHLPC